MLGESDGLGLHTLQVIGQNRRMLIFSQAFSLTFARALSIVAQVKSLFLYHIIPLESSQHSPQALGHTSLRSLFVLHNLLF